MGAQRRYATEPTADLERASGGRAGDLVAAAERIAAQHTTNPVGGVYAGDGKYIGKADDEAWDLPDATGMHRYKRGDRADGADTRLLVTPDQDLDAITELVYLARGFESPAARQHRRVADVLYAAIGAGMLEVVPTQQVEDTAAHYLATIDPGWLTDHAAGLRTYLGLPAGKWTDSAWRAALRGKDRCRQQQAEPALRNELGN
ncbi:hypothetical protein CLV47_12323 [Antricoccus suffuscus]|uniref:Uncharacterized protein n=1 Tax=Antricoccus suffuscus TaxID=1629062 RepID=A0A2T0ZEQ2_9ACTN|nr:hypothetical protein [Antricoccus suffuscus]PRZ34791.1 hypothetical protein CLV47_12323 [Antricoccus suffuscus]